MKKIYTILIFYLLTIATQAKSQDISQIEDFCQKQRDKLGCLRTFKSSQSNMINNKLENKIPIEIKVLPYKKSNQKRFKNKRSFKYRRFKKSTRNPWSNKKNAWSEWEDFHED